MSLASEYKEELENTTRYAAGLKDGLDRFANVIAEQHRELAVSQARVAELEAEAVIAQNNFLDAKIRCAELEIDLRELADDTDPTGPMADAAVYAAINRILNPK